MRGLVVGAAGQDGVLLSRLLRGKGYEVHAMVRATSDPAALMRSVPDAVLHVGDVGDGDLATLLRSVRPDEIYNLAARSSVANSWTAPHQAMDVNVGGVLHLLEAVRAASGPGYRPKLYQASSSEMFGHAVQCPQDETTAFRPVSPYAVSKAAAHFLVGTYREAYDLFAVCGILYNHESSLRPRTFVSRKITSTVAEIKLGIRETLELGSLDVRRDWGYAGDYVEAMWLMMQAERPADYVVATGVSRSLADFVGAAFAAAGVGDWEGRVEIDPGLGRPTEVARLVGDSSKARAELGWTARTSFEAMVAGMVEHDLALVTRA